jgi:signal transduction histidine kinase
LDVVPVARSTAIEPLEGGYRVMDTDGHILDANAAGSRLFDIAPDEAIGRVVLSHDVIEQHRRQRTLQERTRELERQNERLDRFGSSVSHDLRNPLTVADVELEKPRRDGETPDFDRMREAIDRMDDITDDVLELAHQPGSESEVESVDLPDPATTPGTPSRPVKRRSWSKPTASSRRTRAASGRPSRTPV